MTTRYCVLITLMILAFSNCSIKEEREMQEERKLKEILLYYTGREDLDKKAFIISAINGCDICIKKTNYFIKENISNESIMYIVSANSKKTIRVVFDSTIWHRKNFIADFEAKAINRGLFRNYPIVLYCKKGKIQTIKELKLFSNDSLLHEIINYTLSDTE